MVSEDRPGELYLFGCQGGNASGVPAEVVGNKAAHLIRMAEAGLPVPPGLVLPTAHCRAYLEGGERLPEYIAELLERGIRELEKTSGLTFGGNRRPLLVSVRSGAPVSMPGMLDTVLNVGLCDRTLPALIRMTGNPHHAWDSYRRYLETYAEVVEGLPAGPFERVLEEHLRREAVPGVAELDVAALKSVTAQFLALYESGKGEPFPQDPRDQLTRSALAVFRSWQRPRAVEYRRLHGLDDLVGTAVTIQTMVFGNLGGTSGSGVGFTRDPATGENSLYMDFLWNAQGEDVVSGRCPVHGTAGLPEVMPALYRQLQQAGRQLESLFGDAQDFEFTVQEGRLFFLQSRAAKRTAWAALRIAVDQVNEELIDEAAALDRLREFDLDSIRVIRLAAPNGLQPVGSGIAASPGVAVGEVVCDPQAAVAVAGAGRSPILVREDISTADIAGLAACAGVLTARGGRTSHAAVVARQLNKVCIVGCRGLAILENGRNFRLGNQVLDSGAALSLDGHTGHIYEGRLKVIEERPADLLEKVRLWQARQGMAS